VPRDPERLPPVGTSEPSSQPLWAGHRQELLLTLALRIIAAGPLVILGVICIVFSTVSPYFLTSSNLTNILVQSCSTALLALGALLVIVVGSLDISLGATAGFCTIVGAVLFRDHPSLGWLVVPAMLIAGVAIGAINSFIIVTLRVGSAFIVTLGMQYAVFSLSEVASGGTQIPNVPPYIQSMANGHLLGIPGPVVLVLVTGGLLAFFLNRVAWGRWIYAIGGNSDAAGKAGIPVRAVLFSVYVLAALLAAITGVLVAGRNDAGTVDSGSSVLLAFAAVVIGGASLQGGRGKVWATLVGALILAAISDGLTLSNISPNWTSFAIGAVLIAAVALDRLRNSVEGRLRVRQARLQAEAR
jgi:ribose/xylose/arabinose/galactoside ABC-type transport system permease subunit